MFTTNTARILRDPPNLSDMTKWPNAVIDPDLSRVSGLLPQFWRLEDGSVVPMSPHEIRYRKQVITSNGMDNVVRRLELNEIRPEMKDYEVIKALQLEYNQLRVINWAYLCLGILNLILSIVILSKR